MVGVDVLVWDDVLGFAILVARGRNVVNSQISIDFGLIDGEVEVLFRDDFLVGSVGKCLLVKLVLEVLQHQLLLNDVVDALLYLGDFGHIVLANCEGSEGTTLLVLALEVGEVLSVVSVFGCLLSHSDLRLFPQCPERLSRIAKTTSREGSAERTHISFLLAKKLTQQTLIFSNHIYYY